MASRMVFAPFRAAAAGPRLLSGVQGNGMRAWLVRNFKDELVLEDNLSIPEISHPNHVLLKVKAASVNPIDTVMRTGYGDTIIKYLKQLQEASLSTPSRTPFIGGRDCSGVIVQTGRNVKKLKEGDEVMAVIGPTYPGSHAEYVMAMDSWCVPKPKNVSFVEAASFPYAACTAWAALVTTARIRPTQPADVRVLIHGGAGGVGTTAIQMLKAWGVPTVVATCSPDSFDVLKSLGAIPVDYNDETFAREELIELGPYDVILDCVESDLAEWSDNILGIWRNCVHVSLINPVLHDTDRYGLVPGLFSAAAKFFRRSALPAFTGRWFSYAFFAPNSECLNEFKNHVESGKIKAIVERTYAFEDLPSAYEKVFERNGRGKTVIDFEQKTGIFDATEGSYINVAKTPKMEFEIGMPSKTNYTESDDVQRTPDQCAEVEVKHKPDEEVNILAPSAETTLKLDSVVPEKKPHPDMPSPTDATPI